MILSDMRVRLRQMIGNPTTADVSNTDLDNYLNESQRDIMDRYAFHMGRTLWTFQTVVGVTRYQLPTDLTTLMKLGNRDTRRRLILRDAKFQFRTETQTSTVCQPAEPIFYTRMRDWIQLNPVPDKIYNMALFYKNQVADMVNDGDTPVIPLSWHIGIIRYARYLFYDTNQDFAKAQYTYSSWTLWVGNKASEIQDEAVYEDEMGVEMPWLRGGEVDDSPNRQHEDFDHHD